MAAHNRQGWGRALTITVHLVNGEKIYRRIGHDDLVAEKGENLFAIRQTVLQLRDIFKELANLTNIHIVRDGKTIYINPANVLYVETTGFESWEVK